MGKKNGPIGARSEIEMADGTVVPLVITWGLLLRVSTLNKELYKRFSKLSTRGFINDILSAVTIVYTGYLCAYLDENGSAEGCLTEDEFTANVPNDISVVSMAALELTAPKATADFKQRSKSEQNS